MRAFDQLPRALQDWLRDDAWTEWSCEDVVRVWMMLGYDTGRALAYFKREDRK